MSARIDALTAFQVQVMLWGCCHARFLAGHADPQGLYKKKYTGGTKVCGFDGVFLVQNLNPPPVFFLAITTNSTKICTANFTCSISAPKKLSSKTYNTFLPDHKFVCTNKSSSKDFPKFPSLRPQAAWHVNEVSQGTEYLCAETDLIGAHGGPALD